MVCEGVVCEGVVCEGVVCEGVVCEGVVCEGVVCEGVVCEGVVCEGVGHIVLSLPFTTAIKVMISVIECPIVSPLQFGVTCIGFRDTQEKDRFLHQVDRLVYLQQQRSIKLLQDIAKSDATAKKNLTELVLVP